MDNYINKFKTRKPEETVSCIKKFFQEKNFHIKENSYITEADTYYSLIELLNNNNDLILRANGKGMTESYSKASGYAELYERYCNKIDLFTNPLLFQYYINNNYNNHHYYLDKNEKILNYNEIFNKPRFNSFAAILNKNDNNLCEKYFNLICNNLYIGLPYTNTITKEILYLDPRILFRLNTSGGMAAGNSYIEAFNQGISEICEHYVSGLYYHQSLDKYYSIDLNNIDKDLKNKIDIIEKGGNKLYVIDYSYNYGIPVLMSLLVNLNTHSIRINFGSFPVFEIALERVITELFQGISQINDNMYSGLIPYKQYPKELNELDTLGSFSHLKTFKLEILNNLIYDQKPNKDIFLFSNDNIEYNNLDIYNYYIELFKRNNWEIYERNCSESDEMYAIQLYIPNLSGIDKLKSLLKYENQLNSVKLSMNYYKFLRKYIIDNIYDKALFNICVNDYFHLDPLEKQNFYLLNGSYWEWTNININFNILVMVIDLYSNNNTDLFEYLYYNTKNHLSIYKKLKEYITIFNYCYNHLYNNDEKQKIFKFIGIKDTDLNIDTIDVLVQTILSNVVKKGYDEYLINLNRSIQ